VGVSHLTHLFTPKHRVPKEIFDLATSALQNLVVWAIIRGMVKNTALDIIDGIFQGLFDAVTAAFCRVETDMSSGDELFVAELGVVYPNFFFAARIAAAKTAPVDIDDFIFFLALILLRSALNKVPFDLENDVFGHNVQLPLVVGTILELHTDVFKKDSKEVVEAQCASFSGPPEL
jgi:hypothetical protein